MIWDDSPKKPWWVNLEHYPPYTPGPGAKWIFTTPDDGKAVVPMTRYTAMQPQDGSRAIAAATEIITQHCHRFDMEDMP